MRLKTMFARISNLDKFLLHPGKHTADNLYGCISNNNYDPVAFCETFPLYRIPKSEIKKYNP